MVFYLMYVKLEEKHGLIRHIMSILDRATTAVADKDKYSMFLFYINKVSNSRYFKAYTLVKQTATTRTRMQFQRSLHVCAGGGVLRRHTNAGDFRTRNRSAAR